MKAWTRTPRSDGGAFIVDRNGTILAFDQAMETLTGWPACEMVGRDQQPCRGEAAIERSNGHVPLYEGSIPMAAGSRTRPLTLNCADGRAVEIEALTRRLNGPGERVMVTALRVLARSPRRRAVAETPIRDPLTGLPETEAFVAQLEREFVLASTQARPLAVVLVDVDHLRAVNDRFGRDAGDEALRRLAGILRVMVPEESHVCRLADDDFAVLLPGAGRGDARQFAAGLRSTVEGYHFFPKLDDEPRITLSLGAASFPADAESGLDLMERASDALQEARTMGGNRVWCYLRRPRVPVEVPVFFDGSESLLVGYTRDLSPSGIFVQTSVPIEIGMRCALAFPLPGREGRVHVIGRIVRTVPPEFAGDEAATRVPGMGVEFERFSGRDDRHAIESYLHDHESETLRPETGPLSC